ncbi:hypothetical protein CFP56_000608 [Quercus suber]|uniref:Ysc84 actin-binding domain-containing protein n=1 Tax=Quercus suber TaxID=58331 RepID=A0AAW0IPM6_QUESU
MAGAFVGVSLEGNVAATRMDTNLRFYGDPYLTTSDILLGMVSRPKAPVYVFDLFLKLESISWKNNQSRLWLKGNWIKVITINFVRDFKDMASIDRFGPENAKQAITT